MFKIVTGDAYILNQVIYFCSPRLKNLTKPELSFLVQMRLLKNLVDYFKNFQKLSPQGVFIDGLKLRKMY